MHRLRNLWTTGVGLCLVAAAAFVAPTAASAAPPAASAPISNASGKVSVFDVQQGTTRMVAPEAAAAIVTGYWTASRKAAATPAAVPSAAADTRTPNAKDTGVPLEVAKRAPSTGGGVHTEVAFTNTDGRIFFHDPADGRDHWCSGGAVNSGKRRLVLTAGHCVHGGSGRQWMQNWVFDPGYQFGQGSPGAFPAFQLWAQSSWINNSDHHFDYAIAITQNNQFGQRLGDAVGGNGLIINPGRPFITFIGYPGNVSGGEQQAFCQGQLSRRSIFNSDQQLNCNLGGGSSGGPWLQNYSDASGLGDIVSNTSYGINPDPAGPVFGPYYDGDTAALYNAAENASP